MFENENDQNGTQPDNQSELPSQYAGLRGYPGDFAYRVPVSLSSGTALEQNSPAQNGSEQMASGQPVTEQNPIGQTNTGQNSAYLPPIQPRDDQGKTVPKYRMGIGQRILGTVANFANGFARNGEAPIYVGPGALNNRYYQDEEIRRQQNLQNTVPPKGTPAESDGNSNTNGALPTVLNSLPKGRQSIARQRFRPYLSARARTGNPYTYTAVNPKTDQRIGSNDGTTWRDMNGTGSTLS